MTFSGMTLTDPVKVIVYRKGMTGPLFMQIEIHNLTKIYSEKRGLLPTSLQVERGELIAVVGHNGAGKSTLLKMLANWLLPDSGQVSVDGIDLGNRLAVVRKVGFVPETPNLFDFFSVEYNLKLFARLFLLPFARIEEIMQEFALLPFRKNKIQILSKGLKQRVSIGRALLADPPVLLFDEPTSGIDFEMTKEIYRLLKDFHAAGKTILFTSHRPEEIKALATRIIVLHRGGVVFDGSPHTYFTSDIHEELYLC
jgi:ABC-type multidrug transport system ATPase subunit